MNKYFGTDGIRGNFGTTNISPDFLLKLAHAAGRVLREDHKEPTVLIGMDTRITGELIEAVMMAGFSSAGVNVKRCGVMPTPGVAFLTRDSGYQLGVVISASHNRYHDNGIKFFSAEGSKLSDDWQQRVEDMIDQPPKWKQSGAIGKISHTNTAVQRYIEFCLSKFSGSLAGKSIVIDAAHGAAHVIAPMVLSQLGAELIELGCNPNGVNINAGVGATYPETIVDVTRKHEADFGISLDGDADRLIMCDKNGVLYDGDQLLYAMAIARQRRGETVVGVVGTVMTNSGIEEALNNHGIALVRAKVGDKNILAELEKRPGWLLGGESSGHLLVLDKHSTGDGLIAALEVMQAVGTGTLAELTADAPLFPQVLKNMHLEKGQRWDTPAFKEAVEKGEAMLNGNGRVLIRPSGTEPVVRIMVEAPEHWVAEATASYLAGQFGK